ncbi:MAG: 50S ribosomal protein L14e [Candidatus Altiarchaeota archaeon]
MTLLDVGRVCVKVRGRDAGGLCVIVEAPDQGKILVDGEGVRRRKVNILDVEPTPTTLKIKKGSSTESVVKELEKAKLPW